MLGMFRLRTGFVHDALLHLFQFLCVSPVTYPSPMLNLYRGHLLLPLPLRHIGENGSVATIWCLAYRTTRLKAFTSPSVFKLQISSLWESAALLTQDISATMFSDRFTSVGFTLR